MTKNYTPTLAYSLLEVWAAVLLPWVNHVGAGSRLQLLSHKKSMHTHLCELALVKFVPFVKLMLMDIFLWGLVTIFLSLLLHVPDCLWSFNVCLTA